MDVHELRRRFEEWCRRAGGVLKRGTNFAGEEVLTCIKPARGSYVSVIGREDGISVAEDGSTSMFYLPESFEIVFSGGSGWARLSGYQRYGIEVSEPDMVSLNVREKRVYIGSERDAPHWARIES